MDCPGKSWSAHQRQVCMRSLALLITAAVALMGTIGCTPKIGDECSTALDCSTLGDRLCDVTQPGGYCTIFNCEPDACPDEAACVAFNGDLDPACGTADDAQFGRFATTFCMFVCESQDDCRTGYECVRPEQRFARVVDAQTETSNPQDTQVCLAIGEAPVVPDEPPGACYPGEAGPLEPFTPAGGGGAGASSTGGGGAGGGGAAGGAGGKGGAGQGGNGGAAGQGGLGLGGLGLGGLGLGGLGLGGVGGVGGN